MAKNGNANGVQSLHSDRRPGALTPGGPPVVESLFNVVTRRVRAARTLFGENVKLVLRQLDTEHWSLLQVPYCLVVPTVTRPAALRPMDADYDSIINPRSITFIAQLDGRGSEAEHLAANDIELAERQLIDALVNWRPFPWYKPTAYAGMKLAATRAPDVKVSFVFLFYEEIVLPEEEIGVDDLAVLDGITVHVNDPCCTCPPPEPECVPAPNIYVTGGGCPVADPCCAPEPCVSPLEATRGGQDDDVPAGTG